MERGFEEESDKEECWVRVEWTKWWVRESMEGCGLLSDRSYGCVFAVPMGSLLHCMAMPLLAN